MSTKYKYKSNIIEVEAVQWTGENVGEVGAFCNGKAQVDLRYKMWYVTTPEGTMLASEGDYILKNAKGQLFLCEQEIFDKVCTKVE